MAVLPTLTGNTPLNASDDARSLFANDANPGTVTTALTDTPTDFATITSLSWLVEYRQAGRVDDVLTLNIRIVNGATILAAETAGGAFSQVATNITTTTDVTSPVTPFAYVNTAASKAVWDGASVELQQVISRVKGADGVHLEVDYIAFTGEYVAADIPVTAVSSAQVQASTPVALTQVHSLSVVSSTQAQASTPAALTQVHSLSVVSSAQTQASTPAALTQAHNLSIVSSTQTQASATAALTQAHSLSAVSSTQAQASTNPTATAVVPLDGVSSGQSSYSTTAVLTQAHNLSVVPSTQAQGATTATIAQSHMLVVLSSLQGQFSSTAGTAQEIGLAANSSGQSGQSTQATLSVERSVQPVSSGQVHMSTNAVLTQAHQITVVSTYSSQDSVPPTFAFPPFDINSARGFTAWVSSGKLDALYE